MRNLKRSLVALIVWAFASVGVGCADVPEGRAPEWPTISRDARPWTRWWWMGSAVTPEHLTSELEALGAAGFGGVEITPIYGVRGMESRAIPYLSPDWMERLTHTLREADRLDLGVDLATGTGWPFGGPWVSADDAARYLAHRTFTLKGGERLTEPVRFQQDALVRTVRPVAVGKLVEPIEANANLQSLAIDQVRFAKPLPLLALMAYSDGGAIAELASLVDSRGRLNWVAPAGSWTLYALFQGWHGKMVERAAPGGEGLVIDHFSSTAINRYLERFDRAFAGHTLSSLRAFFNDSYEVDDAAGHADWTPAFFEAFEKRRGYDLRQHLPALLGRDAQDRNARVLADYRETISDLILETFTTEWRRWAASSDAMVRNQAHGSPASLLDLYAASDIPETEGTDIMRAKWATSAAHVAGRRLVSAETATWLNEHFRSTLADVRRAIDRFFIAGVNHIVYHGTAYSPPGEPWPGWLFYAAVHFNPRNPWWDDFGALNRYVARVQSFLQAGRPDHDVLLYYPLYDALTARSESGTLLHFGTERPPATGTAFEASAEHLQARGYTYDFISDRQIAAMRPVGDGLESGGNQYRVVVVPPSRFVPLATFERLLEHARQGATVIALGGLPGDVSGLGDLDRRRARFDELEKELRFSGADVTGVQQASLGKGRVLLGSDLEALLTQAGVARESMVDRGLEFARRADEEYRYYFVANWSGRAVEGWIPIGGRPAAVTLFDAMRERRTRASIRSSGADATEVYLQLAHGESIVLAAGGSGAPDAHVAYTSAGASQPIAGSWSVRFVSGGPDLPAETTVEQLRSWTTFGGPAFAAFSGTARYRIGFPMPASNAPAWRLDLGSVRESARVRVNGVDLGTLLGPTFQVVIARDRLRDQNVLEIDVTNLMANRIADLDRRGVVWKRFSNTNFPSRLPENRGPDGLFDASKWPPLESGLLGPVTLTPLEVSSASSAQLAPAADNATPVTISIVGTSDLHGAVFPRDGGGGLPLLAGYVNNLRAARASDGGAVLLLDSGDTFQGSIESNLSEGALVVDAYNAMGYAAEAIGNHDFDFGSTDSPLARQSSDDLRGALKARAAQARYPFLAANLIDEATGRLVEWPNVRPSVIVDAAGVKVGIVGVMTINGLRSTVAANVQGLRIAPLLPTIAAEASRLRTAGAEVVIVASHAGGRCNQFDEPADLSSCDAESEIFQVARELPQGLVDVIAAGHTHGGLAHRVNGIGIIQPFSHGRSFGRIDVIFDRATRRVARRQLFPPRDVCAQRYAVSESCVTASASTMQATYEGRVVTPDAAIVASMAPALERVAKLRGTPLGVALDVPIPRSGELESPLGNLFADALRAAVSGADVGVINNASRGLRSDLAKGPLTFGQIYDVFPFDNRVMQVTLTGADLRRWLAAEIRQGRQGALGISGVRLRVGCAADDVRVELVRANGQHVRDEDRLVVATIGGPTLSGGVASAHPTGGVGPAENTPIVREVVEDWIRGRERRSARGQVEDDDMPFLAGGRIRIDVQCLEPSPRVRP